MSLVDVAIDFSIPSAAVQNISNCLKNGIPIVSGTTGWLENYDSIVSLCKERDGAFIYASNFSLGVNIFFELNRKLAKIMGDLDQYEVDIEEIHHTQKLDAPSGTAITLAEDIINSTNHRGWSLEVKEGENLLPIESKRIAKVPGTHTINYKSNVDRISMTHEAFNREGFALGAVIAAEWLIGKTGIFSMQDVLNIG